MPAKKEHKTSGTKTLRLSKDLYERLKNLASERKSSIQALIRHLMEMVMVQNPSDHTVKIALEKSLAGAEPLKDKSVRDNPVVMAKVIPAQNAGESGAEEKNSRIEEIEAKLAELSLLIQTAPEAGKKVLAEKYADLTARLHELRGGSKF